MTRQTIGIHSLKEACQMLHTTRQTLMKYIYNNDLPYIKKFGKQIFFTNEQLRILCETMNYPFELLFEGSD